MKRTCRHYCNDYDFEIDNIDMPQDHECEN